MSIGLPKPGLERHKTTVEAPSPQSPNVIDLTARIAEKVASTKQPKPADITDEIRTQISITPEWIAENREIFHGEMDQFLEALASQGIAISKESGAKGPYMTLMDWNMPPWHHPGRYAAAGIDLAQEYNFIANIGVKYPDSGDYPIRSCSINWDSPNGELHVRTRFSEENAEVALFKEIEKLANRLGVGEIVVDCIESHELKRWEERGDYEICALTARKRLK